MRLIWFTAAKRMNFLVYIAVFYIIFVNFAIAITIFNYNYFNQLFYEKNHYPCKFQKGDVDVVASADLLRQWICDR